MSNKDTIKLDDNNEVIIEFKNMNAQLVEVEKVVEVDYLDKYKTIIGVGVGAIFLGALSAALIKE